MLYLSTGHAQTYAMAVPDIAYLSPVKRLYRLESARAAASACYDDPPALHLRPGHDSHAESGDWCLGIKAVWCESRRKEGKGKERRTRERGEGR
eukprot:2383980-Rhodomonas_salina.2